MTENDSLLFLSIVFQYQELAMVALGKVPGPDGKISPINLDAARYSIEMLEMLERKCKGNLTSEEEKNLRTVLTNLRLNYVDEFNKSIKKDAAKAE